MTTRLFLLKLCATLSAMICGGCQPLVSVNPQPNAKPMELKITIDGEGKINVGGDASITAKSARESEPQTRCNCGCGQDGCSCPRGQTSAASTVGTSAGSGPQRITQKVWQCRNGVCGWYDAEVSPIASVPKRLAAPSTQGGKIKVYISDSPACRAMRDALRDVKGIDFERGTPPEINGTHWWPTAVKPNGTTWTPASAGWHAGSLAEFLGWRGGELLP